MARPPRFILPGYPQHVIVRGNNRDPIFASDEDYSAYLDWLKKAASKHKCAVHAYVLMTNHVHMLITPSSEQGLGKLVQMVGRYYVQYFNHQYQRTGTLWEGRYKASLVDTETYLLVCQRYIELNPVRANMVEHPAEYPWSSYRHNALGKASRLISHHQLYEGLGDSSDAQQGAYRSLFDTLIDPKTLDEIRASANKGWVLGSPWFQEKVEAIVKRPVTRQTRGGDRKSKAFLEQNPINRN